MYKLSIVIPVYNNINFTKSCLEDLKKLPEDHQIIIVNNASNDGTFEYLDTQSSITNNLLVFHNKTNEGFAKACNRGYSLSSGKNVMFLNNDIKVRSDYEIWTNEVLKYCNDFLVGPTAGLLDKDLNFVKECTNIEKPYPYMSGWNLSSSKENWEKLKINNYIGPFSEEFGLAYFEDTDLSFRAIELNIPFKIIEIPVVHFGKMTSRLLQISELFNSARKVFLKKWRQRCRKL